ncbi:MAG: hypothetical protein N2654_02280 [Deltaproteobacteria bacterium]|nr:hypothetical protein [Deltaproteobacteria bacterium]
MIFVDFNLLDDDKKAKLASLLTINSVPASHIIGIIDQTSLPYDADFPRILVVIEEQQFVVRFLDKLCVVHKDRLEQLAYLLNRWKTFSAVSKMSFNFDTPNPWFLRKFFPKTLEDLMREQNTLDTQILASKILDSYFEYSAAGLIHGHLSPSNLAVEGEKVVFLDPLLLLTFPWRNSKYLAPEKTISPQADYFSLGALFAGFKNLPPQYSGFIIQALNDDPKKRPSPEYLRKDAVSLQNFKASSSLVKNQGYRLLFFVFLCAFLGVLAFFMLRSRDTEIEPPTFTHSALIRAIESKDQKFLEELAEYLISSGDKNYFELALAAMLKYGNLVTPKVKKIVSRLNTQKFTKQDVKLMSATLFFEYVSPTVMKDFSFEGLTDEVKLAFVTITNSEQVRLNFAKTEDNPTLAAMLEVASSFNLLNQPGFLSFVGQLYFEACDSRELQALMKNLDLKPIILFLRGMADRDMIPEVCYGEFFSGLSSSSVNLTSWFSGNTLVSWDKIDAKNKLILTLGLYVKGLTADYYLDLLKFPISEVAERAFEEIEKSCKNSLCKKSLLVLYRYKDTLSREQAVTLGSLVFNDTGFAAKYMPVWLSLAPPPNVVLDLILARDTSSDEDPVLFFSLTYLLTKEFSLNLNQKITMVTHKDPKVRRLGIIKLNPFTQEEKKLLLRLKEIEVDRENQSLIKQKLELLPEN